MLELSPLTSHYLEHLKLQPAQHNMAPYLLEAQYQNILLAHPGLAVLSHQGEVIACAGILPQTEHRAYIWALLGSGAGRYMVALHKQVSSFLAQQSYIRLETVVTRGFTAGERWVRLLGFTHEGRLKHFMDYDRDAELYAYYQKTI